MATNNFVYWSDGLEGRAFDHHRRNGGRGICQQKFPAGLDIWKKIVKCPKYARGFARGNARDSHIICD